MTRTVLASLALASVLLAACSSEADAPPLEATPTLEVTAAATRPAVTPELAPLFYVYETAPGETIEVVAERFGVSPDAVRVNNKAALAGLEGGQPPPRTELVIPAVEGVIHRVRPGDTIESIAQRYGVAPEAITSFASNLLEAGADLEVGMVILVPGGTGE